MNSMEQKHRKRALIAWMLVFSLLTCAFWFGRTETQAATAVDGVSLTVEYNTGGTSAATTQTYYRYYVDEAAGTKEESVTITTPSESEISLADGQVLTAWKMTDASQNEVTILPGESVTVAWEDVIGETTAVSMYIYGTVREYSVADSFTGGDWNTYYISNLDSIGGISINRSADSYTITAPGTPIMDAHEFVQWQLLNSDGMVLGYADAGGVFQTDGSDVVFAYSETDALTVSAEWTPVASIYFYEDMYDMSNPFSTITVTQETDETGTKALSFTMPSAPVREDGSVFLAWYEQIGYSYRLPGETVTYNDDDGGDGYADWPALSSGYTGTISGTWLTPEYEFGDVEVANYDGTISIDAQEDSFTIFAPDAEPEASGYFFNGWSVLLNDTTHFVSGGETISGEDGSALSFLYSEYADSTVTLTAQWQEVAWAAAWFDLNGGAVDGSSENVAEYYNQTTPDEATFIVTMLKEPVRSGYLFHGWQYTDASGQTYTFSAGETTENVLVFTYGTDTELMFTALWEVAPTPTPTSTPMPTPTNTPTPTPVPTSTPTPIPTSTPTPTPTPEPTPTPAPMMVYEGEVELWSGDKYQFQGGTWMIEGDNTVYEGWIEFYVPTSGTYTIKEGE